MKIIRDYQFIDDADKGAAVAIGNFDGVHLGHKVVIDIARVEAEKLGAPVGVLTFEPHPREYFSPDAPAFRLMNADAKASQLAQAEIDNLYQLPFNSVLSSLSAREFARDVIAEGLGLKHVVVGADFCFGKDRSGNAADLVAFGKQFGFGVTIAELKVDKGEVFSSSAIRRALTDGRVSDAADMLGHWYRIESEVIHGEQRGRELGYPTANISIDGLHPAKFGVYATVVDIMTGPNAGRYHGAASIGERPTFGVYKPNLEVFIFDFSADIYGETISVALVDYQRPELKFDDLDGLIIQMKADCDQARATLDALDQD